MEKTNKKKNEAPHLTVVEFKVEHGFATSGISLGTENRSWADDWQGDDNGLEQRGWGSGW